MWFISLLHGEENGKNVEGSILGMEFQSLFSYIGRVACVADTTYHWYGLSSVFNKG